MNGMDNKNSQQNVVTPNLIAQKSIQEEDPPVPFPSLTDDYLNESEIANSVPEVESEVP